MLGACRRTSASVSLSGLISGVAHGDKVINHLDFGSTAYDIYSQRHEVPYPLHGTHLHLEQADTGLDTLNRGLSEKLDRVMMYGHNA